MPVPHVLDTEIHIERNLRITMCFGHYPSPFLFKTQHFGDWVLSPSSGKRTQLGPIDTASPYCLESICTLQAELHFL